MEAAIGTAVKFLLENLFEQFKENNALISGAGSKATKLFEDLEPLRGFVTKYTEEHYHNEILTKQGDQIRNLISRAEDAIEEYIYYAALKNDDEVKLTSKKMDEISKEVYDMYVKIEVILGSALKLEQAAKQKDKRRKLGLPVADKVIGFEDAARQVIQRLTGKELEQSTAEKHKKIEVKQETELKKLEVVSIHGMLGLGKTTLARKVLSDPVIEYEFFTRIFVVVSNDYDKKKVLQDILVKGNFFKNDSELKEMSIDDLIKLIGEKLRNKYLVVLDDVWESDVWNDLKPVFPDYEKGSRVLITTRNRPVAEYCKSRIEPYELHLLKPNASQELLRIKVFDENTCPKHLEKIETDILKKCDGLPLAIVVTAGILRNDRKNKEWWVKVFRGVDRSNLIRDDQEKSEMLIKMSYDHLPYQLKPCFLYLGVFPEDVDILVWKLLRLWIAEGFIQQDPDATLEEIAEEYLRELVDRNLVMVDRSSNGKIKTCRVHDTLRCFCKKMAIKEGLFREIRSLGEATDSTSLSNSRRLCANTYVSHYIRSSKEAPYVRSFLSFAKDERILNKDNSSRIVRPFKLLRVLDIKSTRIVGLRLPQELPTLVLLKYIALNCDFKTLPKQLSSLFNLQTIIIDTTSSALDIKLDLWKMRQLRHLHTNASATLPKCQEDSPMVNLQTLSTISPESCTIELLDRTPKIKKLGIRGKLGPFVKANRESSLFDTLLMLENLEILKLQNDDVTCKLCALPFAHNFPANLKKLSLENTSLKWKYMSTLGKLECLEVLKLKEHAFEGKDWETEDGGFLCLKVLFIGATDLKFWEAKSSNFPELRCLILKHCSGLEGIPSDFANIKSLEMIDLEHVNPLVVSSAKNMELRDLKVLRQRGDLETSPLKVKIYPPQ